MILLSPFLPEGEFASLSVALNSFLTMFLPKTQLKCAFKRWLKWCYFFGSFSLPCSNILFPPCIQVCFCRHSQAGPLGFLPEMCVMAHIQPPPFVDHRGFTADGLALTTKKETWEVVLMSCSIVFQGRPRLPVTFHATFDIY